MQDYFSRSSGDGAMRRPFFLIVNKMKLKRTSPTEAVPPRDGAQSLRRSVNLLRTLSTHTATGWRMSDLADETGLDHTTVHRMLTCLVQEGLVARVAGTRRYTLGPLTYELGLASTPYYAIDRVAAPALRNLAARTKDLLFLNVRSGFDSVCIARYEGGSALKAFTVNVGTRRPLSLSAGGVAMMVAMPPAEQSLIEEQNLRSIVRRGEARQAAVRRMLQRSRRLGYGLNLEDIIPGIAALGVAIRTGEGIPVASISLAATSADLDEQRQRLLLERLQREAANIEAALGQLRY